MLRPDDVTLTAYADGELDAAAAQEVEEIARGDSAVRAQIDALVRSRTLLHAAYNAPLHEPAPLQAAMVAEATFARADNVVPLRRAPRVESMLGWALAAGVAAFVIGFGSGKTWENATGQQQAELAAAEAAFRQAVSIALETLPNGQSAPWASNRGERTTLTPVRTFLDDNGQYCRDYLLTRPVGGSDRGRLHTACREAEGDWVSIDPIGRDTGA